MREATRMKLDRQLRMQKLKWAGIGAAIVTSIAGLVVLTDLDASVADKRLAGVVTGIGPIAGKEASRGLTVDVKLDESGRTVQVLVLKTRDPKLGEHVEITEHDHGTGRVNFTWK